MFVIRPQKCLYHPNHNLLLFCKCSSCYLPVCEVCIRIHKNEHIMYQTEAQFDNSIDTVIKTVHNELIEQQRKTAFLEQHFNRIPPRLVQDENSHKNIFLQQRQKIIARFECLLIEVEKSLIKSIQQQQMKFLADLQSLDRESQVMKRQVTQKLQSLEHHRSETRMETIIQFHSEDKKQLFDEHFDRMVNEIQKCSLVQLQIPQLSTLRQIEIFLEEKLKAFEQPIKTAPKTQIGLSQNQN